MSELQLLAEVLQTQTEAEAGGVKYIYMDENTIYRFENNKMKKVSAALIKKAQKAQQQQQNEVKKEKKEKKQKKKQQPQPVIEEEEEQSEEETENEVLPQPKQKREKKIKQKPTRNINAVDSPIDLNEYWQVKSKLEYQDKELERLTGKIHKLKQYKNIVSRLTGGEYNTEYVEPQTQQQIEPPTSRRNDSLFMF